MNIVIASGIFPPDIGGPATYVPFIAEAMVRQGHEVTVVCLADDPHARTKHFAFQLVRLPRRMVRPLRSARTIRTLMAEGRRADVIFANGLLLEAAIAAAALRVPLAIKIVGDWAWERSSNRGATARGFEDFQRQGDRGCARWLGGVRSGLVRRAQAVIVPSRYLAGWVADWGVDGERIHVVPNAYLPEGVGQPRLCPLKTRHTLVSVGRLVPWKRVDQLIEIVAAHPALGLVVVGDGPEQARLEDLTDGLGARERVYFAGRLGRPATLALMSAADLFVLNSTYEGLPHVVLEALGLGVPVVATAVGGTPEIVEHGANGILVPPGDRARLESAIVELLEDRAALTRMSKAARESVVRFAPDEMIRRTEEVLRETARWPKSENLSLRASVRALDGRRSSR